MKEVLKKSKDDEKTMGPMFPRLHVNDTGKGGPRAPPRNKMALYERLSVPSQRFNYGSLHLQPNNTGNTIPTAPSSQETSHEGNLNFPRHSSPSAYAHHSDKFHRRVSNASTFESSSAHLEQRKKGGDDNDFSVPVFVQSRFHQNAIGAEQSSTSPKYLDHVVKRQNGCHRDQSHNSSLRVSLKRDIMKSKEDAKVSGQSRAHSVKSASTEKINGFGMLGNAPPVKDFDDQRQPFSNISKSRNSDTSLHEKCRARTRPYDSGCGDGDEESVRDISNSNLPQPRSQGRSGENDSNTNGENNSNTNDPDNNSGCYSTQMGNTNKSDAVSENSMVYSISPLDIFPDDVVEIIGQKHFWKARRAIVNQQRVFAVQLFELHRLVKVQQLIATSPQLFLEDGAFLGNSPLKVTPTKKLPSQHIEDLKKANHKMECSAESAGEKKTSLSSMTRPSNYEHYLGSPQPEETAGNDNKTGSWCFHQSPGHQWLVPVMSPSEGLVYKPYPVPGYMGSMPLTGNFLNPAYGVPTSHQGIGVFPNASPMGHTYFLPYGMPVMNSPIPGSGADQMNNSRYTANSNGQMGLSAGAAAPFNLQQQSSCNVPIRRFRENELQGSSANSYSETAQGRDVPVSPLIGEVITDGGSQFCDSTIQPARVIRVVPRNPRSATESAARIFRSIQEERKQHESI